MSTREYQTLTYIMYQENLDRERREEEEKERARRADEERRKREQESDNTEDSGPPKNRAEMLLQAKRTRESIDVPDSSRPIFSEEEEQPVQSPRIPMNIPMDELVELLEDEM